MQLTYQLRKSMVFPAVRGVQDPVLFTVSAKREAEGAPDSGFAEFREFLRSAVESGEVWRMKLEGSRDTVCISELAEEARLVREAAKLRRLADALEGNRTFQIEIAGNRIRVPPAATVEIEYSRDGAEEEVEIELKWRRK